MNKGENKVLDKLAQAVIGMPDNPDDNGMVGDIKEIEKHLKELNGSVSRNVSTISKLESTAHMLKWSVGGLMLLIIAVIGCVIAL